jgi:hypothetical protein
VDAGQQSQQKQHDDNCADDHGAYQTKDKTVISSSSLSDRLWSLITDLAELSLDGGDQTLAIVIEVTVGYFNRFAQGQRREVRR